MADLKLFVDTMMFLHFRPLGELNLRELFGVDSITVVVPAITIKELDKHKSTHPSSRVRDRAKKAIALFEAGFADRSSRIVAEFFPIHPKAEIDAHSMNADSADEVLVAAMLAYQTRFVGENLALLTDDAFPRLLCKQHGLRALSVEDSFRLVDELDPKDVKIRDLTRTVQKLASATPKLNVFFSSLADKTNVIRIKMRKFVTLTEAAINEARGKLERQYPKFGRVSAISNPRTFADRMAKEHVERVLMISESERLEYDLKIDRFINDSIEWIRLRDAVRKNEPRLLKVGIGIENTGTLPAEDVSVTLLFPSGIQPILDADVPDCGDPPRPPKRPESGLNLRSMTFATPELPDQFSVAEISSKRQPEIEQATDGRFLATDEFDRLKHGMDEDLFDGMSIVVPPIEDAKSFQCEYQIHVGNMPDPTRGELHFVIEKD